MKSLGQTTNRIEWLDLVRGILALCVILSHTDGTPELYHVLDSFMLIPGFFLVSGYVCKIDRKHMGEYYGNRVLKMFLLYVIWMFIQPFVTVSKWKLIIEDPMNLLRILKGVAKEVLMGGSLWFLSCLIVVMLIFSILYLVSRDHLLLLAILSFVIFCVGFIFAREGQMFYWSADTALVGQFFYVIGYILKKTDVFEKEFFVKHEKTIRYAFTFAYFAALILGTVFIGKISINMALNTYHNRIMTFIGFVVGNGMLILWARRIGKLRFFNYVGSHSLVYFALGSLYTGTVLKGFLWLSEKTGSGLLANPYFINPMTVLVCGAATLIPCLIIDRWAPALNGRFQLFKKKEKSAA